MKKTIAATISTLACLSAVAQGTVNFQNIAPGGPNAPVFLGDGVTKASGPAFKAQLFAGTSAGSMAVVGPPATFLTGGGAGYFVGGTVTIPTVLPGATAFLFVDVWDSTLGGTTTGATDEEARAYQQTGHANVWGESNMFTVTTGGGGIPPNPPANLIGLVSFSIGCLDCCIPCCGTYFSGFFTQPQSQTVLPGTTVTFTVAASACPYPFFQWYLNGNPIFGATYSTYRITNAQPSNAGAYWAVLSNQAWGIHSSDVAMLSVQAPPTITAEPQTRTAELGSTAEFMVQFVGAPTPACQWFFNYTNAVPDGTGPVLRLPNVQPAQSGAYVAVLLNVAGTATTSPAMLSVIPPLEHRLVPALDLAGQFGSLLNLDFVDALGPPVNWQLLSSVVLDSSPKLYFDLSSPLPPQRFYRAWQTGAPAVSPNLDLYMAPAITLTGAIGRSVRLDAINVVGPTNAWFTLATITLTNTSQVYPDASAIGQLPRLWRIVRLP